MRGQVAVEYTILTAISIALFAVVAIVVYTQMGDIGSAQTLGKVRTTLQGIVAAAQEVYQEGSGAHRLVLVSLPSEVDPSTLNITNNTITVRLRNSDISVRSEVPISGSFQNSSNFYVDITSAGASVLIGAPSFIPVPASLFFTLCANVSDSQTRSLTVINNQDSDIDVNFTLTWSNPEINLTISNSTISIPPSSNASISATATVLNNTVDIFTGTLAASSSNYSTDIPITASTQACQPTVSNTSYILIRTYRNSSYGQEKTAYDYPANVVITTGNWTASSLLTLDILDPNNASVTGYPKAVTTNSTGGYSETWAVNSTTLGTHTIRVNNSVNETTRSIVTAGC